MNALDPTSADLEWARVWFSQEITAERARYADMYVLTAVRVMLDRASVEKAAKERNQSVRRARALIVALEEFRQGGAVGGAQ